MWRAVAMLSALACASVLAQAPFSESVTVEVMNVDVVALDRNGVAVGGLRAEDFELRVNGQPVAITNFSAYDEAAGTELALESAPSAAAATVPAPRVVEAPPPVTWLLYVDLTETIRNRRKRALDQIETFFRDGGFRRNDRILVAVFQGDAFRVLQPLTGDLNAAGAAMQTLRNWARPSRGFAEVALDDPPEGPLDLDEKERRTRVAINGIRDLTTVVDGIDRRRPDPAGGDERPLGDRRGLRRRGTLDGARPDRRRAAVSGRYSLLVARCSGRPQAHRPTGPPVGSYEPMSL